MWRRSRPKQDGHAHPPAAPKRQSRPATGRSFLTTIALACLATLLVVAWTLHSLSEEQERRSSSPGFRM